MKAMNVQIFADVSTEKDIEDYVQNPLIKGFTTNPSLLKKAGVTDYLAFGRKASSLAQDKSISFEVVSDEENEILREANIIASLGNNILVKIPFLKTDGSNNAEIIQQLSKQGIKLNITAVLTNGQVSQILSSLDPNTHTIISIFAGRIADTGIDPEPIIKEARELCRDHKNVAILWASTRELFNIAQAERCGCDIITVTPDFLKKTSIWGADLVEYSRQTAEMFYQDAKSAGFKI